MLLRVTTAGIIRRVALCAASCVLFSAVTAGGAQAEIHATISRCDIDGDMERRLCALLSAANTHVPEAAALDKALAKFNSKSQKGKFTGKDITLNYLGFPRGLTSSIEGAQLALDTPESARNLEAAQYGIQVLNDRLHEQIVCAILELASGLGCREPEEALRRTKHATELLENLVGPEEAAATSDMIVEWTKAWPGSNGAFHQRHWDVVALREKTRLILDLAAKNDLESVAVKNKLHYFGDHSKTKQVTAKAVEGTVSAVTMLGPGLGVPIGAQAVGAAWGVANGGSEEAKLLKELYYSKKLDTRSSTLTSEVQLCLASYQESVRTKNIPLLVCSEALLVQYVGAVGIPRVIDHPVINHGIFFSRTLAGLNSRTLM